MRKNKNMSVSGVSSSILPPSQSVSQGASAQPSKFTVNHEKPSSHNHPSPGLGVLNNMSSIQLLQEIANVAASSLQKHNHKAYNNLSIKQTSSGTVDITA